MMVKKFMQINACASNDFVFDDLIPFDHLWITLTRVIVDSYYFTLVHKLYMHEREITVVDLCHFYQ